MAVKYRVRWRCSAAPVATVHVWLRDFDGIVTALRGRPSQRTGLYALQPRLRRRCRCCVLALVSVCSESGPPGGLCRRRTTHCVGGLAALPSGRVRHRFRPRSRSHVPEDLSESLLGQRSTAEDLKPGRISHPAIRREPPRRPPSGGGDAAAGLPAARRESCRQ